MKNNKQNIQTEIIIIKFSHSILKVVIGPELQGFLKKYDHNNPKYGKDEKNPQLITK